MGLDSYILKYPKIEGITPKDYEAALMQYRWLRYIKENPDDSQTTFHEFSGYDESVIPEEPMLSLIRSHFKNHRTFQEIIVVDEEVAYWRKVYFLHTWFVNYAQDGEDDCEFHRPLTKGMLKDLVGMLDACARDVSKFYFFFPFDVDKADPIELTIYKDQIQNVIDNTDFETEELYYLSSW